MDLLVPQQLNMFNMRKLSNNSKPGFVAIEMSSVSDLDARMLDLYHSLALFVAENFQHMYAEEHENNETLWALYSDAELHALHAEIMASLDPVKMVNFARWILPYVSHRERAAMLAGMQKAAPVPVSHFN